MKPKVRSKSFEKTEIIINTESKKDKSISIKTKRGIDPPNFELDEDADKVFSHLNDVVNFFKL